MSSVECEGCLDPVTAKTGIKLPGSPQPRIACKECADRVIGIELAFAEMAVGKAVGKDALVAARKQLHALERLRKRAK